MSDFTEQALSRRWLLAAAALLLLALWLRLGLVAYALYAVLGLLLVSRGLGWRSLTSLRDLRRCSAQRANVGDVVSVEVQISNHKRLPGPWMVLEEQTPEHLPCEGETARLLLLRAGESWRLSYRIRCAHRGYHQVGPLVLESGDLFGLVRRFALGRSVEYLTVYPKVVPLAVEALPSRKPGGEAKSGRSLFDDPSRLAGVRPYRPGDSMKRVHWKATARTGELQTKVFEPTVMIGANLILDFHRASYEGREEFERSELAVTTAASLAAAIIEQREQVGLVSNGRDAADRIGLLGAEVRAEIRSRAEARQRAAMLQSSDRLRPVEVPVGRGEEGLDAVWHALARLELSDGLALEEMLTKEYRRFSRDAALVVIVPRVTDALAGVLGQIARIGFQVRVLLIDNPEGAAAALSELAAASIPAAHIEREEDLHALAFAPARA